MIDGNDKRQRRASMLAALIILASYAALATVVLHFFPNA